MRVGIIGLGTAGSAAAAACARRGLAVVGVERGPLDQAGARWVNGVPRWTFAAGGVSEPIGAELRGAEAPFHLVAGWGPAKIVARSALEVDMRHLVARLQAVAREHGADLRGSVTSDRLVGRTLRTSAGDLVADVWVDASGVSGHQLLGQPDVDRRDLCAAAQEVRELRDPIAAARFRERFGAQDGEPVCFSGVAGGYSIVNVRVDGLEVGLLTGSIPAEGQPGGKALLDRFAAEHSWVGARVFGGARAIPIRRAWEVVGWKDRALIGDSASQVYAAHGSGVGMQLVAAELLAAALAEGRGVWGYNVAWQRAYGGMLAASDLFRRLSSTLSADEIAALMARGALSPESSAQAMEQRPIRLPLGTLIRAAAGLARVPRLGARLLPTLARMRAVEALWAAYPASPEGYPAWASWAERLTGIAPWPASPERLG